MGTDAKGGGKGKGKQAGGSEDGGGGAKGKGKGKGGKAADGLGTCTYVKARHILCEKQGKINEVYKKLQDGWLSNGDKVPPAEFAKVMSHFTCVVSYIFMCSLLMSCMVIVANGE
ncbi:putative peptidyl-prolyl cis-trans isomerase PIN4 [Helianthus anomalus]